LNGLCAFLTLYKMLGHAAFGSFLATVLAYSA